VTNELARGAVLATLAWALHCQGSDATLLLGGNAPGSTSEPGGMEPPAFTTHDMHAADDSSEGASPSGATSTLDELSRACGSGVLTLAGDQALDRHPYLQQVTDTSALVLFTTRVVGPEPVLELRSADGEDLRRVETELDPSDATGRQRIARIGGLSPDTIYCYTLDDWLSPVGFRTAPSASSERSVRFIAFGDSGGERRGLLVPELARSRFDLILHVGDIAYWEGSLGDFEVEFFDTYASLLAHAAIFPASGNHEYGTPDAAAYRQVFALPENGGPDGIERWFSYDWSNVHFVALDTERVGPAQADWLEADLARNALPWTIVYFHRPPYSSGVHGGSGAVRATFVPSFERHGVQLVLSGHDHDYERTRPVGGVTYVVTGGGGYSIRRVGRGDVTAYSASAFHFLRVEVQQDELYLEAVDPSGAVIDATLIPRVGPR
jgi:hypothetical protein